MHFSFCEWPLVVPSCPQWHFQSFKKIPSLSHNSKFQASTSLDFYKDIPTPLHTLSPVDMHTELAKVDPEMANRLHPNDLRRVTRALQIYHQTGVTQSEHLRKKAAETGSQYGGTLRWPKTICLWLMCDKQVGMRLRDLSSSNNIDFGISAALTTFCCIYFCSEGSHHIYTVWMGGGVDWALHLPIVTILHYFGFIF